ncbi:MAG TPA: hypothetical protein ENH32_03470 [Proteobacteria bacterium]|nr:hypothetical protein [Pseudomonadota bacterium]
MGMANAFVGQADDPSAVHHNVAGITGLEGIQIMAGFTRISPRSEYEGVDAVAKDFYPPYFFYTNRVKESDWWVGFGINTPFGLGTDWKSDAGFNAFFRTTVTPLNPVDVIRETTIEMAKIAPVAAYRVNDKFSIGFGPEYYLVNKVVYKGGSSDGLGTGWNYSMKGDGHGIGFTLGGLYQASDSLRVGLAWHSGVTAELSGTASAFPDSSGVPYSGPASVDLNLPDTLALGISYLVNDSFTVNLDLDRTQWSDYDKLEFKNAAGAVFRTVNKNYDDVLAVRVGGSYRVNELWTVRAGFLTEPTPVIDKTFDPRLPDADATGITVGFGYDTGVWAVNGAYMALSKDDRIVDSDEPSALPTLYDGTYKNSVDLVSLDLTYRFQ